MQIAKYLQQKRSRAVFSVDKSSHIIAWTKKKKNWEHFCYMGKKNKRRIYFVCWSRKIVMPIVHVKRYLSANSTQACTIHIGARAHANKHGHIQIGIKHLHNAKLIHWETYVYIGGRFYSHAHQCLCRLPALDTSSSSASSFRDLHKVCTSTLYSVQHIPTSNTLK